jgi:hypothetical protein
MNRKPSLCRTFGACRKTKQLPISVSASRCWSKSALYRSSSVAGRFMTWLTWMGGSTNISTEGGSGRKLYGP